ncbi:MAG TPA: hypothetical protein VF544_24025 [Pyrinomonadaceae bacterium]
MTRRIIALSLLFVLTISLTLHNSITHAAAMPQANVIQTNEQIPIEFFNANSCTGDTVTINGTSHVLFTATGSPGGHSNAQFHINFALQGVNQTSGTKYVVNETVQATTESSENGAFVFNTVSHLNVVSQGSEDNLLVRTEIHATFNANGELTSSRFVFTVECQG